MVEEVADSCDDPSWFRVADKCVIPDERPVSGFCKDMYVLGEVEWRRLVQ